MKIEDIDIIKKNKIQYIFDFNKKNIDINAIQGIHVHNVRRPNGRSLLEMVDLLMEDLRYMGNDEFYSFIFNKAVTFFGKSNGFRKEYDSLSSQIEKGFSHADSFCLRNAINTFILDSKKEIEKSGSHFIFSLEPESYTVFNNFSRLSRFVSIILMSQVLIAYYSTNFEDCGYIITDNNIDVTIKNNEIINDVNGVDILGSKYIKWVQDGRIPDESAIVEKTIVALKKEIKTDIFSQKLYDDLTGKYIERNKALDLENNKIVNNSNKLSSENKILKNTNNQNEDKIKKLYEEIDVKILENEKLKKNYSEIQDKRFMEIHKKNIGLLEIKNKQISELDKTILSLKEDATLLDSYKKRICLLENKFKTHKNHAIKIGKLVSTFTTYHMEVLDILNKKFDIGDMTRQGYENDLRTKAKTVSEKASCLCEYTIDDVFHDDNRKQEIEDFIKKIKEDLDLLNKMKDVISTFPDRKKKNRVIDFTALLAKMTDFGIKRNKLEI